VRAHGDVLFAQPVDQAQEEHQYRARSHETPLDLLRRGTPAGPAPSSAVCPGTGCRRSSSHLGDAGRLQHRDPVDQLAGARWFADTVHPAHGVERRPSERLFSNCSSRPGWCTSTMRAMRSRSGKSMKWNTQRRRNASGSSFSALLVMITTGRCCRRDLVAGLGMTVNRMRSSSWRQVVGELDVGLVDLVDEQHHTLRRLERATQCAHVDVLADVAHVVVPEAAVVEPLHGVVVVQPLLRPGGALDVPGDQRQPPAPRRRLQRAGSCRCPARRAPAAASAAPGRSARPPRVRGWSDTPGCR
jgi:hypothetical protein